MTGKGKPKTFGSDNIVHVGLKDAVDKGIITSDEASVIDGILESFPESWREHFEPRFSEQEFVPTAEQERYRHRGYRIGSDDYRQRGRGLADPAFFVNSVNIVHRCGK